jgi:hypothetical protein
LCTKGVAMAAAIRSAATGQGRMYRMVQNDQRQPTW